MSAACKWLTAADNFNFAVVHYLSISIIVCLFFISPTVTRDIKFAACPFACLSVCLSVWDASPPKLLHVVGSKFALVSHKHCTTYFGGDRVRATSGELITPGVPPGEPKIYRGEILCQIWTDLRVQISRLYRSSVLFSITSVPAVHQAGYPSLLDHVFDTANHIVRTQSGVARMFQSGSETDGKSETHSAKFSSRLEGQ